MKPQSNASLLDLSIFPPRRRIAVAAEVTVQNGSATLFDFSNSLSTAYLTSIATFVNSFQSRRVIGINVYFDQRGSASTAAVPRVTAFLATGFTSSVDPDNVDLNTIARYAGSGINQVVPGKNFYLKVGPEFSTGRFQATGSGDFIVLVGDDYQGTVRLKLIFEVIGIPADISPSP
jgi:hypothetical protein